MVKLRDERDRGDVSLYRAVFREDEALRAVWVGGVSASVSVKVCGCVYVCVCLRKRRNVCVLSCFCVCIWCLWR